MTTLTLTNAIARLNELLELNPSYTKAKLSAFLTVEDYSAKVIKGALLHVKPVAAKAQSFANVYYAWLAEAPRTRAEAEAYILNPENSDNVRKHLSHYMNICDLTITVRSGMEAKGEPSEIDLAWMNLKAEMKKARPAKTKVHPDRVSHLGDEALTKAYAEAFKKLNTKK